MESKSPIKSHLGRRYSEYEEDWLVLNKIFDDFYRLVKSNSSAGPANSTLFKAIQFKLKWESNVCAPLLKTADKNKTDHEFSKSFFVWQTGKLVRMLIDGKFIKLHSIVQDYQLLILQGLYSEHYAIFCEIVSHYITMTKKLTVCLEYLAKGDGEFGIREFICDGYLPQSVSHTHNKDCTFIINSKKQCEDMLYCCLEIFTCFPEYVFSSSLDSTRDLDGYIVRIINTSSENLICYSIKLLALSLPRSISAQLVDWKALLLCIKTITQQFINSNNFKLLGHLSLLLEKLVQLKVAIRNGFYTDVFGTVLQLLPAAASEDQSDCFDHILSLMDFCSLGSNINFDIEMTNLAKQCYFLHKLLRVVEKYLLLTVDLTELEAAARKGFKRKRSDSDDVRDACHIKLSSPAWNNVVDQLYTCLSVDPTDSSAVDHVRFICAVVETALNLKSAFEMKNPQNRFVILEPVLSIISFVILVKKRTSPVPDGANLFSSCVQNSYLLLKDDCDIALNDVINFCLECATSETDSHQIVLYFDSMISVYLHSVDSQTCSSEVIDSIANVLLTIGIEKKLFSLKSSQLFYMILSTKNEPFENYVNYFKSLLYPEFICDLISSDSFGKKLACFLSGKCKLEKVNSRWDILCFECDKRSKDCEIKDLKMEEYLKFIGLKFTEMLLQGEFREQVVLIKDHLPRYMVHTTVLRSPFVFKILVELLYNLSPQLHQTFDNVWMMLCIPFGHSFPEVSEIIAQVLTAKLKHAVLRGDRESLRSMFATIKRLGQVPVFELFMSCWKMLMIFALYPRVFGVSRLGKALKVIAQANNLTLKRLAVQYQEEFAVTLVNIIHINTIIKSVEFSKLIESIGEIFGYESGRSFLRSYINPAMVSHIIVNYPETKAFSILEGISSFLGTSIKNMVLNILEDLYVCLFFHQRLEIADALGFIESYTGEDLNKVFLSSFDDILSKVLTHASDPRVLRFIAAHKDPTIEVKEFINSNIVGLFTYIDSTLQSKRTSDMELRRCYGSLPHIIHLVGSDIVTTHRVKILATLRAATLIHHQKFSELLLDAWVHFLHTVCLNSIAPQLSTIFITLLPLLNEFPKIVSSIFHYLVVTNKPKVLEHIPELYFVTETGVPEMKEVWSTIQESLNSLSQESWEPQVRSLLQQINSENNEIKFHAFNRLHMLLKRYSNSILESVLRNDVVDPLVIDVFNCLVTNLGHNDIKIRKTCGVCLGELSAVDPARIGHQLKSSSSNGPSVYDPTSEEFIFLCISEMLKGLQNAKDSFSYTTFAGAIRQLLHAISITENQAKLSKFLDLFPPLKRDVLEPLCNSRYLSNLPPISKVKYPHPIFGTSAGNTITTWAYHWSLRLINFLRDPVVKNIFTACAPCMKADVRLVLLLLPHLLLNVLLTCTDKNKIIVEEEMKAVLQWSLLRQDSNETFMWRRIGICREIISPVFEKAGLDQSKCISIIFDLLAFLNKFVLDSKRKGVSFKNVDPSKMKYISEFLDKFPNKVLSAKAYVQEDYCKSLLYFEKHLESLGPNSCIHPLRNIYSKLNDTDGLIGVMSSFKELTHTEDMILSHVVQGNLEDALIGYRHLAETQGATHHYRGLIQCYLSLDQPFVALQVTRSIMDQGDTDVMFCNEYAEVLWNTLLMNDLDDLLGKFDESMKETWCWGIDIGTALCNLSSGRQVATLSKISDIRNHVVEQLWAISNTRHGGYVQSYDYIVKLHILNEFEKYGRLIKSVTQPNHSLQTSDFEEVIGKSMEMRLEVLQPDNNLLQRVLSVRRACLNIIKALAESHHVDSVGPLVEQGLTKIMMTNLRLARKSGSFQKASNLVADAEPFHPLGLFVEKAKLLRARCKSDVAVLTLKQGINHYFPNLEGLQNEDFEKKILCAKAKLLVARYNEESINVDVSEGGSYYKEAMQVCTWEKSYKCFAQYLYKIIASDPNPDSTPGKAELQLEAAKYFGQSLIYGAQFIYQSLPCMLSLWLDFAARLVYDMRAPSRAVSMEQRRQVMDKFNVMMSKYVTKLPTYMFMTAFSQILSRIGHPYRPCFDVIKEIIVIILISFPQQAMWMFISTCKSPNIELKQRCDEVFQDPRIAKKTSLVSFIQQFMELTTKLIDLSNKPVSAGKSHVSLKNLAKGLPTLLKNNPCIMVPAQKFRTIYLPNYKHFEEDFSSSPHNPFPSNLVYLCDAKDDVQVLSSMQKPKKITFIGTDGNEYPLMCKPMDDLRLDSRVMEFNSIVNMYLRRDGAARERDLHVRTYSVVPLSPQCGLIEWLDNLLPFRHILLELYSQKNLGMPNREIKALILSVREPLEKKRDVFLNRLLPKHPSVFQEWFYYKFPDPETWYMARLRYVRTAAVMSMVGYIVGLGDRHGENILIDSFTGELVHVDFNCLFNKGETLEYPEVVPFRLTHNMVKAMGPTGIEGPFIRACIETTRVMRNQVDQLLSVVKPFLYDRRDAKGKMEQGEYTNDKAKIHISKVSKRLKGSVMTMTKNTQPLSVEGQVRLLINEATAIDNLCQMFIGWAPYL